MDDGPTATLRLDDDGALTLGVENKGRTVLEPGAVGITTDEGELTSGLELLDRNDRTFGEKYTTTVGKERERTVRMAESRFTFENGDGRRLALTVRAADDGVAYRYELPDEAGDGVTVTGESSAFQVPDSSKAWLLPYTPNYEAAHIESTAADAKSGEYGYPTLFRGDGADGAGHGDYTLLSESDVDGRYDASRLTHEVGSGGYDVELADDSVSSPGPLNTPWRTVITGDLATVTESTLVDDLAPASRIEDTSWIRPGKVAWSWMDGGQDTQRDLKRQKEYVDYAAEHGWEYALVDEGWKDVDWVPELIEYADERGVKIMLWMHYSDLDTADERKANLDRMTEWGVAGMKIDFMDSDSQARFRWYDEILQDTADRKLTVNFHGSTIPHGIQRTWPHVMSMEAVHGAEQLDVTAANLSTLPYTRNVVGSMDFTPMGFQTGDRPVTDAGELALSVVFESGFQNFAGAPEEYAERPELEHFLSEVPTVWDETKLLAGEPGKETTVARRDGERWFLGSVTSGDGRTQQVSTDFLGEGSWTIDVVTDGPDGLVRKSHDVEAGDTLEVTTPENGGFVAIAQPA
ncbi:glycoside hydrolase family 97 protein [Streptomyces sp. YIM 130001]|uniref:glycoside hydrolase family 97 protein n=1 Tax=Streptomyces sp. YIM 130001 TaxID=2259644 RepID=UPI001F09D5B7|nr:glycoside hydrolase family 97 protein [Streptomyces sp. YIM 130001]